MIKKNSIKFKYLLKGLFLAFLITIVLLLFFSLLLRFTSLSESKLSFFNNITMIISVVIAGIFVAMKIKENGWLNGALIGLAYYLIIIVIGFLFIKTDNSNLLLLTKLILSIVTGIIGGMIGINLV